jgi:hypothetical protein
VGLEVLRGESEKRQILQRERIHCETLKKILAYLEPPGYRVNNPKQVNIETRSPSHIRVKLVHLVKNVPPSLMRPYRLSTPAQFEEDDSTRIL